MTGSGYLAEFVGTALLILFGNGVVANVVFARTKGNDSGWIVITIGRGLAVFIGPRIAHALLPVPGKRDSDWSYAWVPVVAPLVGGALAAAVQAAIPREQR